ncbi:DUF4007 family protein [Endozoicomonas sp. SCSIO W0465]|uniref:DUF4007 family protein n=1 Tax=Endozoicomonas sp. SCSIO W0465 TaxID=2918516 RepID=UPI0020759A8B|nr:DUF4007 family protein [Endozoicomonas sp. SCSIO W0465]USE35844.1 DUF4007 family protein [Endozoicomonas sp. SCSIO W0465]
MKIDLTDNQLLEVNSSGKKRQVQVAKYTAKFSGHETFPLRYGWLYKAVSSVREKYDGKPLKPVTSGSSEDKEKAVVRMGVGKNMVSSIAYWAIASKMIDETNRKKDTLTEVAADLFGEEEGDSGWDPYMERVGTVWLLHWLLNRDYHTVTSYRWFFNRFNGQRFDKQQLLDSLTLDAEKLKFDGSEKAVKKTLNYKTVSKDIDCFLQGYTYRNSSTSKISEDSFSSPLVELGLIRTLEDGRYKKYSADLGEQESLPIEVFTYALMDYWFEYAKESKTISFDRLLTAEGSPARIFRLSQSALANRLDEVEELTEKRISWTDTQGLRQIQCDNVKDLEFLKSTYLRHYYKQGK